LYHKDVQNNPAQNKSMLRVKGSDLK